MKKFRLKERDNVYLTIFDSVEKTTRTHKAEIVGFYSISARFQIEDNSYISYVINFGLFYAFLYYDKECIIVTTKKWHLPFALILEKIRVLIPSKIAEKLELE